MPQYNTWRTDRFTFTVTGRGAQRLFAQAAQQGIRLRSIRCASDGYRAIAAGRDRARLEALMTKGGWQWTVSERQGPGLWLDRGLRRLGLPIGAALFFVLVRLLSGFVWTMDFGGLETARQQQLRTVLAENGILEGAWLTQEMLLEAQGELNLHSEWFGWLSLNFAGGCLYVESTPLERQPVEQMPQNTALYAKAGGEVLTVDVDSGFAAVVPGQYVDEGRLLAASVRLDRSGRPVVQAASGRVIARVQKTYTFSQPLQQTRSVLAGPRTTTYTLHLLGRSIPLYQTETEITQAQTATEWLPLRLGQVTLPACLYRTTAWELRQETLQYSEDTAAALARRACRLQLAEEFPDAVVESQQRELRETEDGVQCITRYVFRADIALSAPSRGEKAP